MTLHFSPLDQCQTTRKLTSLMQCWYKQTNLLTNWSDHTFEVPKSSHSRNMIEGHLMRFWSWSMQSSSSFVMRSWIMVYERRNRRGIAMETLAFFKYSSNLGMYPLLNHWASKKYELHCIAHCKLQEKNHRTN